MTVTKRFLSFDDACLLFYAGDINEILDSPAVLASWEIDWRDANYQETSDHICRDTIEQIESVTGPLAVNYIVFEVETLCDYFLFVLVDADFAS
ncbi:MAG: hypothetical protein HC836_10630 [Richelia sp. RM2_1_2]|nr:hypothetical protein [Richelia sp. RM2_1_2]